MFSRLFIPSLFAALIAVPCSFAQRLQANVSQDALSTQVHTDGLLSEAEQSKVAAILSKHPERRPYIHDGITGVLVMRDTHIVNGRIIKASFSVVKHVDPHSFAFGRILENDLVLAVDGTPASQHSVTEGYKRAPAGQWRVYTVSRQGNVFDVHFQMMPLYASEEFFQDFYAQGQLNPNFSPTFYQASPGQPFKFSGTSDPYANNR